MPRLISSRPGAVCALALILTLAVAANAAAKSFSANLRVVGSAGKVLAEKTLSTATVSVKTRSRATCFGAGTGGSGKPVSIPANTAMGLLAPGSRSTGSLRPLLISDHFEFGLALCGIGTSIARGQASWYLKIDHKAPSVGGEKAKIHAGDEVLWDLAPSYPYPEELALRAPVIATAGVPFTVTAFTYNEKGKRRPAAGVTVTGASALTGSDGKTTVTLASTGRLSASKVGDIPSARVAVCVGDACPAGG